MSSKQRAIHKLLPALKHLLIYNPIELRFINMYIFGILLYSILFIYLLHLLTRKKVPLTVSELSLAFLFKVGLGCLYGYIYLHSYNGDDTWLYHQYGLQDLEKLKHEPLHYFTELLPGESFKWAGGSFWHGLSVYIHTLEND